MWEKILRFWRGVKITIAVILSIGTAGVVIDIYLRLERAYGPRNALLILFGIPALLLIIAIVLAIWYKRRDGRIRR